MSESRPDGDVAGKPTSGEELAAATESEQGTSAQEGDDPEFVNRAARRAKGKAGAKPTVFAKGKAPVGRGAVQSPRQYGARRSG